MLNMLMLNIKAQSHLADAIASILRAQLRASSDALAASLRDSSTWTQMLTARRATDEDPMPAHSQWAWSMPSMAWSMPRTLSWPIPWPMPWPLSWSRPWPMPWAMHWPGPGLWEGGSCDAARLGFVLLGPIWWAVPGGGLRAPLPGQSLGKAGWILPHSRLSEPVPVRVSAAYTAAGPGSNPGSNLGSNPGVNRDSVDASFARYRSAGGHALAQVIVRPTEEVAEETARVWLTPLEVMLGIWRAALVSSLRPHCEDAPARRSAPAR
jgi:hypothetical protein